MLKRFSRSPRVQAVLAWLVGRYLAWALSSTRWTIIGEENLLPFLHDRPMIVAFWHECLPLMSALFIRARRINPALRAQVLVSRHNDGRFIGDVMRRFGLEVAHGSSMRDGKSRGGVSGAMSLLGSLESGAYVIITPDGPRGPRHQAAAGVALLAGMSGMAVLPCAAQTNRRRVLSSWDRMILPLPWGRGVIVCGAQIRVARDGARASLPVIAHALGEVAALAQARCP
jgi:lysophospholipid acyltransferase (LPLAT)-like uncharacterized protein